MPQKTVRIRDIADALGISIGTVDRALHNRGRIDETTRERVLQMAKTLGYRPNAAARFLSSKRRIRISVSLPEHIASFWDRVREGVLEEARLFASSGIEIELRTFPHLGVGELDVIQDALSAGVNAIIMATGRPQAVHPLVQEASRAGISIVTITCDAPGTDRLAAVSVDSSASGALAGELLGRLAPKTGTLAVVTGDLAITDHAEKFEAFRNSVNSLFPGISVPGPLQNHDDGSEAYSNCRELLNKHPSLGGLYISTANSAPVLQALKDAGWLGVVPVITTDLFPPLIEHLRAGRILGTLYQRPRSQGRTALRILHDYLVERRSPAHQFRLFPHLIMKSNLNFFLESISAESDGKDLTPWSDQNSEDTPSQRVGD